MHCSLAGIAIAHANGNVLDTDLVAHTSELARDEHVQTDDDSEPCFAKVNRSRLSNNAARAAFKESDMLADEANHRCSRSAPCL